MTTEEQIRELQDDVKNLKIAYQRLSANLNTVTELLNTAMDTITRGTDKLLD